MSPSESNFGQKLDASSMEAWSLRSEKLMAAGESCSLTGGRLDGGGVKRKAEIEE